MCPLDDIFSSVSHVSVVSVASGSWNQMPCLQTANVYVCIYIYMCVCVRIYIYIYIYSESTLSSWNTHNYGDASKRNTSSMTSSGVFYKAGLL